MSRHDPRRALALHLPDPLRRALVAQVVDHRPLPALVRAAVLRGLRGGGQDAPVMSPGPARPLLLQLSRCERRALASYAAQRGLSEESAALTLAAYGLGATF